MWVFTLDLKEVTVSLYLQLPLRADGGNDDDTAVGCEK